MIRTSISILLVLVAWFLMRCSPTSEVSPTHSVTQGAVKAGGEEWDQANAVAVDQLGNTYVTGFFSAPAQFGSTTISSSGGSDIFIAKYNRDLDLEWVTTAGGPGFDQGLALDVDRYGYVYVTGSYNQSATFGGKTLTAAHQDVFVVRLDPTGNFDWVKKGSGEGSGLAIQSDGDVVYVTGYFVGTIRFSGTPMTSHGGRDIFVVKYDADSGIGVWTTHAGGPLNDIGSSIGIGPQGSLYVGGSLFDHLIWDDQSIRANRVYQGYLARLNSDEGKIIWGQPIGGARFPTNVAVAVDATGDCLVTGNFTDEMSLGGKTLYTTGNADLYIARFHPGGDVAWVHSAGGSLGASSISVDLLGNAYVTGPFQGEAFYAPHAITSVAGDADVFVTKYNRAGHLQWTTSGAFQSYYRVAVAADPGGSLIVAGSFNGTAKLGSTTLKSVNNEKDIFVWRLSGY